MASKSLPTASRPKAPSRTTSLNSTTKVLPSNRPAKGHGGEGLPKLIPERKSTRHAHSEKKIFVSRGVDLQNARIDHLKANEQLNHIEKSKVNLMQDLARARRNVEELTTRLDGVNGFKTKRVPACERENVVFLQRAEWQVELDAIKQRYELALVELQTSKQAMENLKHELMFCVEAKDEAVRLAAEAMNAAETTARRVEMLSAGPFSIKGVSAVAMDNTTPGIDDLIDEIPQITTASLFEAVEPVKITEDENLTDGDKESLGNVAMPEMIDSKAAINGPALDSEIKLKGLTPSMEVLETELLVAKEAERKALDAAMYLHVDMERANSERESAKMEELAVQGLLAKALKELEELKEKFIKADVEEITLLSSLDSLKSKLVRKELDLIDSQNREANANKKVSELTADMERSMEAHRAEIMSLEEREATARTTIESLKNELHRQKSELAVAADQESTVSAKVANMIEAIERNRSDLMEHQRQFTYEVAILRVELETAQSKLIAIEERESTNVTKISRLLHDLEKSESEVRNLQEKLLNMESRAEALNVELESLRDDKVKLETEDAEVSAQLTELNGHVVELQQALEEASSASIVTKEDLSKLQSSFEKAILDRDAARRETQAALLDSEVHKQAVIDGLAKAVAAKEYADRALEAASKASDRRIEEALVAAKSVDDAAQAAREEAYAAKEKLEVAIKEAETSSVEGEKAMKKAQLAREEVRLIKAALTKEEERANAAEDDVRAVLDEVKSLRTELTNSQTDAMEARLAMESVESRLQSTTVELESLKASALVGENSADLKLCGCILQEELDCVKQKLEACEERLVVATNEMGALRISREELLKELEVMRVEKEANKKAVLEAHQHLADLEKAKSVMEGDIQRLLDESKMWKTSKDTRDIPVLSEMDGLDDDSDLVLDSREEKPQPDSPGCESSDSVLLVVRMGVELEPNKDKEEEMGPPHAGAPLPSVVKKKRHALLHSLHYYLDKKKSMHTP